MAYYLIFHFSCLLAAVVAILLLRRQKINRRSFVITIVAIFLILSISDAFQGRWFGSGWNVFLASIVTFLEYRTSRYEKRQEKEKKELSDKMARFDKDLEEYRRKRNGSRLTGRW